MGLKLYGTTVGDNPEALTRHATEQAVQFFGVPEDQITIALGDVTTFYNHYLATPTVTHYETDFTAHVKENS